MTNIAEALHSTLGGANLEMIRCLAAACGRLGCDAYVVGGTVRDVLMGVSAADLDVTVVSPPDDFVQSVAVILNARVVMASQFGTAKLEIEGLPFDLVTARSERYPSPGALPEVTPGSLDDDLARRDFTINSMAVSLSDASWGQLIDPHRGRHDLENGSLRALHGASFRDDATRILRAARYASRFGFRLDESTRQQLEGSVGWLASISSQRLKRELERVFEESNVSAAFKLLSTWGALDSARCQFRFDATSWCRFGEVCPVGSDERRLIGWGLLSLGFEADQLGVIVHGWELDADAGLVSADTSRLRDRLGDSSLAELAPSGRVAMLEQYNIQAVKALSMSTPKGPTKTVLDDYIEALRMVRSTLDGHDVLALGVPHGPRVGEVLQMLKNARLDGVVHTKTEETLLVRRFVSEL